MSDRSDIPLKEGKDGALILHVRVQPRSSKCAIVGVEDETLKVKLTAPPAEGEANEQLIKLLSKELGVPKSNIQIIRGETSRNKTLEIRK